MILEQYLGLIYLLFFSLLHLHVRWSSFPMHACFPKDTHCPSWPHAIPDHLGLLTLSRDCFSLPGRGGHKHTEVKRSVKETGSKALEEPAAGTQVR